MIYVATLSFKLRMRTGSVNEGLCRKRNKERLLSQVFGTTHQIVLDRSIIIIQRVQFSHTLTLKQNVIYDFLPDAITRITSINTLPQTARCNLPEPCTPTFFKSLRKCIYFRRETISYIFFNQLITVI